LSSANRDEDMAASEDGAKAAAGLDDFIRGGGKRILSGYACSPWGNVAVGCAKQLLLVAEKTG
jgi:hypothetical protein